MLSRDYIFEFAGMPKSGKTTVMDAVVHYLKRSDLRVSEFHGGGRYSPIDKGSLGSLNIYLAIKAVEFLVVGSERERVHSRIFLMDRGIFDRAIFTRALSHLGKISDQEASTVRAFLSLERFAKLLDEVFLFVTEPTLSLARENVNRLVTGTGRVMNIAFLETLYEISCAEANDNTIGVRKIRVIDTAKYNGDVVGCARIIAESIVSHIEAKQC